MDNFDEKLNAVLSSPDAMDKIMNMARSMGGGNGAETSAQMPEASDAPPAGDLLGSLLGGEGGIDPNLIGKAMQLFGAYNQSDPQKAALMQAIKPYLRPARRERVDQAMQTLKLANVAKEAFGSDILGNLFGGILGRK